MNQPTRRTATLFAAFVLTSIVGCGSTASPQPGSTSGQSDAATSGGTPSASEANFTLKASAKR